MSEDTTTRATAQSATQTNAIDLTQPQLLGLFGGADRARALLRSADGTIIIASPNDTTPMGDVMAITNSYVLLRDGPNIRRLTLPL